MNENIIQRIVRLTKEQGRQDKELCEYIGVAQSTFVNWKNRNTDPKSKYLPKIADFLNVSLDYLTTGVDQSRQGDANDIGNPVLYAADETEQRLLMLCRKAEADPAEKEAIVNQFEATIDIYLRAKGIKKE